MRIATWNINSLKVRLPRVEAWLAEVQPDIVCLQETKVSDKAFPALDLRDARLRDRPSRPGAVERRGDPVEGGPRRRGRRLRRRRRPRSRRPHHLGHVRRRAHDVGVRAERPSPRPGPLPVQAGLAGPAAGAPGDDGHAGAGHRRLRRLQRGARRHRRVRPGGLRRRHPRQPPRASGGGGAGGLGSARLVPHGVARREAVFVVGLPRRRLPLRAGACASISCWRRRRWRPGSSGR